MPPLPRKYPPPRIVRLCASAPCDAPAVVGLEELGVDPGGAGRAEDGADGDGRSELGAEARAGAEGARAGVAVLCKRDVIRPGAARPTRGGRESAEREGGGATERAGARRKRRTYCGALRNGSEWTRNERRGRRERRGRVSGCVRRRGNKGGAEEGIMDMYTHSVFHTDHPAGGLERVNIEH